MVTHDQDLIDRFATRIWAFEDGQFVDFLETGKSTFDAKAWVTPALPKAKAERKKKKKAAGLSPTNAANRWCH